MKHQNVIEGSKYNGTDMGNPGLDKLGADIDKDTSPRKLISDFIVNDEHSRQSKERRHGKDKQPNYRARRAMAMGAAILATAGVSKAAGNDWITGPPVRAVEHIGQIVKEANEPKGREIPIHVVQIENADGVKGSRVYVQQGNSNK